MTGGEGISIVTENVNTSEAPEVRKWRSSKRDQSENPVASLEKKLARLELAMGETLEKVEAMEPTMEGMSYMSDTIDLVKDNVETQREEFLGLINELREGLAKLNGRVDDLKEEVALHMATSTGGVAVRELPYTKAPEPLKYGGKRNPKELNEFMKSKW